MQKQPVLCYELKIQVSEQEKEIVAQLLEELEVGDFVYGQIDCDIEAEYDPSKISQDLYNTQAQNPPIILYNEDKEFLQSVQLALESLFVKLNISIQPNQTFILQEIQDQNWRESWKQSFKPVLVQNTFAILPPWEDGNFFTEKFKIIINPGMAFGTGQHETTRLCLEALLKYPAPKKFLDVGTGSGILALAAKMLGASFVLGTDIDPECQQIAQENAKLNFIQDIHFVTKPLSHIEEIGFDTIVANIQSRPLKILVPDILKHLGKNGILILSGILLAEKEDFCSFLINNNGVKIIESVNLNDWCAIVCTI